MSTKIQITPDVLRALRERAEQYAPDNEFTANATLALIDAYAALSDDLDKTRLVIEEAPLRCSALQVTARYEVQFGDEPETFVVCPEQVRGVMEYVRDEVHKIGDWSAYRAWEREDALRADVVKATARVDILEKKLEKAAQAKPCLHERTFKARDGVRCLFCTMLIQAPP